MKLSSYWLMPTLKVAGDRVGLGDRREPNAVAPADGEVSVSVSPGPTPMAAASRSPTRIRSPPSSPCAETLQRAGT